MIAAVTVENLLFRPPHFSTIMKHSLGALSCSLLFVNFTLVEVGRTEQLPVCSLFSVNAVAFQYRPFIFVHLIWHDSLL